MNNFYASDSFLPKKKQESNMQKDPMFDEVSEYIFYLEEEISALSKEDIAYEEIIDCIKRNPDLCVSSLLMLNTKLSIKTLLELTVSPYIEEDIQKYFKGKIEKIFSHRFDSPID